jgi:SAM-dependent methyltransferase
MPRYFSAEELDCLRRLRAGFLGMEESCGPAGIYWESLRELELYDETFAQRIGWKWDAVLGELARRARLPGGKSVLDWGCGTGIAVRRFLAASPGIETVYLWDHSRAALDFACGRLAEEYPGLEVRTELPQEVDVVLVSHVLEELGSEERDELVREAARAPAVLWVEPGSRTSSRALGELRAGFLATHDVLAPCTHQAACGALARADDWCHFFGRPPQAVFTEGAWAELGRELGIDLRSLPYSFLVLARRGSFALDGPGARFLDRPSFTRGRVELRLCREAGVEEVDFLQRTDKRLYKALERDFAEPWLGDATVEDGRIVAFTRREC